MFGIPLVNGNHVTMKETVSIDSVGRLVLPKRVREALGIRGKMVVEIELIDGRVELSAPRKPMGPTKRRRGRLIYDGPLAEDWESGEAITRMRERRLQQ